MKKYSLFAGLVLMMLACNILRLPAPERLSFVMYICGDSGSALRSTYMFENGIMPWADYVYNYGLGTLLLNQFWFHTFGYTPVANEILNLVWMILLCWALAELIEVMRWKPSVRAFLFCVLPFAFCWQWCVTAHILAPALILLSVSMHLRGKETLALLFATLALLVMPALAFFLGLYLMVDRVCRREGMTVSHHLKQLSRMMAPSFLLLVAYTIFVGWRWGWEIVHCSLLPFQALATYQEADFGIFNRGRLFWLPPSQSAVQLLEHYVMTPAGLWLAGTFWLTYQLIESAIHCLKTKTLSLQQRCILICGTLHLAFIFFLYGDDLSWTSEPCVLILGVAASLERFTWFTQRAVFVVAMLALCGLSAAVRPALTNWLHTDFHPEMNSLFLSDDEHRELIQLHELAKKCKVMLVAKQGASSLLLNPIKDIDTSYFSRIAARPHERRSLFDGIDQSDVVVVPIYHSNYAMAEWPEVAERLNRFTVRHKTRVFLIYTTETHRDLLPPAGWH